MRHVNLFVVFLLGFWMTQAADGASTKARIFVVSSYHAGYLWSQDTHAGVCAALLDFNFLDNKEQVSEYTATDYVESSKAVVKKVWMDSKRKNTERDLVRTTARILNEIETFKPDLILLGDDNAADYIGNQYIDSGIPVIFGG